MALYKRSLVIFEKHLGPDDYRVPGNRYRNAEEITLRRVRGGELGLLAPSAGAAREDIGTPGKDAAGAVPPRPDDQLPLAVTHLVALPPVQRLRHELEIEQLVVQLWTDGTRNDVIDGCQLASVGAFRDRGCFAS